MRERGVQSRRGRTGTAGPASRPPTSSRGPGFWQALAIIALIAATAGWTTVAVLAFRDNSNNTAAVPTESDDPDVDADETDEPPPHDIPDLEAALPVSVNGTALQTDSLSGDAYLADDPWSTSITAFLTGAGKTGSDLQLAEAGDPAGTLDLGLTVYRVAGVPAASVRDALFAAWKVGYPDLVVTETKLGGVDVSKGDFGPDSATSYVYVKGDLVYDIETSDEAIATATLVAIQHPGASTAPAGSAAPGASAAAPAASASAAP